MIILVKMGDPKFELKRSPQMVIYIELFNKELATYPFSFVPTDYEYPPQEYDEEYNNYDPETVKYEQEEPSHFQTEEY